MEKNKKQNEEKETNIKTKKQRKMGEKKKQERYNFCF